MQLCTDCRDQYEMTLTIIKGEEESQKRELSIAFQDCCSKQKICCALEKKPLAFAAASGEKQKTWKGETHGGETKWVWAEEPEDRLSLRISSRNMGLKDCKLAVRLGKVEKQCVLELKCDQLTACVSFSSEERKRISPNASAELVIL